MSIHTYRALQWRRVAKAIKTVYLATVTLIRMMLYSQQGVPEQLLGDVIPTVAVLE